MSEDGVVRRHESSFDGVMSLLKQARQQISTDAAAEIKRLGDEWDADPSCDEKREAFMEALRSVTTYEHLFHNEITGAPLGDAKGDR